MNIGDPVAVAVDGSIFDEDRGVVCSGERKAEHSVLVEL